MILGFDAAFIPLIVAGRKVHTIRQGTRWRVGQPIHFYDPAAATGTFLFWPTRPVVSLQQVHVTTSGVRLDGRWLAPAALTQLARADGFADAASFLAFFERWPAPFHGQLVHWTALRYEAQEEAVEPSAGAGRPETSPGERQRPVGRAAR